MSCSEKPNYCERNFSKYYHLWCYNCTARNKFERSECAFFIPKHHVNHPMVCLFLIDSEDNPESGFCFSVAARNDYSERAKRARR